MEVGGMLIDELTNEELQDPSKLRLVIKQLKRNISTLKDELEALDGAVTDDEKGLKVTVRDLIRDVETLNNKLDAIVDAQQDTRKTIKNSFISGGIGVIVSGVIGFVLKQLGMM
ncbi:hypothetical protein [Staphylococcus saprophyticus]|uniref:hypothetical protein n=1 Tax=Staphylococcus saprophyticus TaxID=29385 RepID=UPI0022EA3D6D|nr:hypothetical protein [Staphylococcus saprophyticus]